MSYRLEKHEKLSDGIKRIATEQLDKALKILKNPGGDPDEAIHDARKRFKKIRAAIRIVRKHVGQDFYKQTNVFYRDLARELAPARDSVVRINTLDDLKDTFEDQLDDDAFNVIRKKLVEKYNKTTKKIIKDENKIKYVINELEKKRNDIKDWPIKNEDFSSLYGGIKKVYKRGFKAFHKAYKDPTSENFHDWRKRVKYLWYHTRILRNVWEEIFKPLEDYIHDLSDFLGDDHDYAELGKSIIQDELAKDEHQQDAVTGLIIQRHKELRKGAKPLAGRIYAEDPKDFVNRVEKYWDIWTE